MRSDEPMVLEARRGAQPAETGLVSVIVPCFGQLEHTRICVPRILRYTRSPFEIVFVDAGALDGTSEYLSGVAAIPSVHAEVVQVSPELAVRAAQISCIGLELRRTLLLAFEQIDLVRVVGNVGVHSDAIPTLGCRAEFAGAPAPSSPTNQRRQIAAVSGSARGGNAYRSTSQPGMVELQ